ncbi:MAG: HEPN domain-containing protein [Imperialibacter sp.]|uniref:HEPN domain-containing protein n=1 Tax=Imperialibacter sp. TaxID=2038411 RepID=UPI0032EACC8D
MTGPKEDYINYRIEKSSETYNDALLLAQNQRWNSCVNRLYYSSYYLVSALLYKNGVKAETHNGTKTQFFLNFVKNGPMDKSFGRLYAHLFDWRQETDYADFIDFNEETVLPLLGEVRKLNEEIHLLIKSKP